MPEAEVAEFLADWSPRLRGARGLVSSDGSVELPERGTPELVLTATFEPARAPRTDDRVHLQWRWHVDGRKDRQRCTVPSPTSPRSAPRRRPVGPGGGLDWFVDGVVDGADVAVFANELLPQLVAHGVRTVVQGERLDYERLSGRPNIRVTTMPSEKHDWFDLGIIVSVNGKEIPFTPLLRALAGRARRLKLIDNSYLSLAARRSTAQGAHRRGARPRRVGADQPMTVTPLQAGLWSEFDQLADETSHDERAGHRRGAARCDPARRHPRAGHGAGRTPAVPARGYAWLSFLRSHGVGGVLADDMGLGKTLQVLAMIAAGRAEAPSGAPFLVVAPTSVVGNWASEAARFVPSLRVSTVTSTSLKDPTLVARTAAESDVVVTSYALLRLDAPAWSEQSWSALVLDEARSS